MTKRIIYTSVIAAGTWLTSVLGGWDTGLKTLTVCMILDYILGMTAAGIFHRSKKTENAGLLGVPVPGALKKAVELLASENTSEKDEDLFLKNRTESPVKTEEFRNGGEEDGDMG